MILVEWNLKDGVNWCTYESWGFKLIQTPKFKDINYICKKKKIIVIIFYTTKLYYGISVR